MTVAGKAAPPQVPRYAEPRLNLTAASEAEWQLQYHNPARRVAFAATLALVFIKFGFVQEILQVYLGTSLYVLYILTPPAVLGVVLSGRLRTALSSTACLFWIAFAVWLAVGIPFSSWRGGSISDLYYYLRDHLSMLFLIAGTAMTWRHIKLLLYTIAAAAVVDVLFVQFAGMQAQVSDRLQLDFHGTVANANDLAAHMLLLLCVVLFSVLRPGASILMRVFASGTVIAALYVLLRTASRGALVALVVGAIIYMFRATGKQRAAALALVPLLCLLIFAIPKQTLVRILSFSADEGSVEAAMSRKSREELLRQSIRYTIQKPVFGVGMGQFSIYEGSRSREAVGIGNYHETHNAYTQVSSECGVPALLFYIAAIFSTVRILLRASKMARAADHGDLQTAALCVLLAVVTFTTAIIFLSLAYRFYLPALTGVAIALEAVAVRELGSTRLSPGRAIAGAALHPPV